MFPGVGANIARRLSEDAAFTHSSGLSEQQDSELLSGPDPFAQMT